MPPKKMRATTTKSNIQTEKNYNEEIVNYKNQITLLQKKVEEYKKIISTLQDENIILKNQSNNSSMKDKVKDNLIEKKTVLRDEKMISPRSGIKVIKGCSCKGNCSNKICGCVKKGTLCGEFCKCNDAQCKNQEPEKENFKQDEVSIEGHDPLEKLRHLSLTQETLHASEKKAKRGIFSPFGTCNSISSSAKNVSASPLALETKRKLFTQDLDDFVHIDININKKEEYVFSTEPKHLNLEENGDNFNQIEQLSLLYTDQIGFSDQQLQQKNIGENIKYMKVPPFLTSQSNQSNKEQNIYKKVIHSPPVLQRKSMSTSPEEYASYKKHTDGKNTINLKSKSMTPKKQIISTISPQFSDNEVNESKNKMEHSINIQSLEIILKTPLLPHQDSNKNYISFESNASESRSSCNNQSIVRIFLLILLILLLTLLGMIIHKHILFGKPIGTFFQNLLLD